VGIDADERRMLIVRLAAAATAAVNDVMIHLIYNVACCLVYLC